MTWRSHASEADRAAVAAEVAQLEAESAAAAREEAVLRSALEELQGRLTRRIDRALSSSWAFLTHEDVRELPGLDSSLVFAVRAPRGSTLEVPDSTIQPAGQPADARSATDAASAAQSTPGVELVADAAHQTGVGATAKHQQHSPGRSPANAQSGTRAQLAQPARLIAGSREASADGLSFPEWATQVDGRAHQVWIRSKDGPIDLFFITPLAGVASSLDQQGPDGAEQEEREAGSESAPAGGSHGVALPAGDGLSIGTDGASAAAAAAAAAAATAGAYVMGADEHSLPSVASVISASAASAAARCGRPQLASSPSSASSAASASATSAAPLGRRGHSVGSVSSLGHRHGGLLTSASGLAVTAGIGVPLLGASSLGSDVSRFWRDPSTPSAPGAAPSQRTSRQGQGAGAQPFPTPERQGGFAPSTSTGPRAPRWGGIHYASRRHASSALTAQMPPSIAAVAAASPPRGSVRDAAAAASRVARARASLSSTGARRSSTGTASSPSSASLSAAPELRDQAELESAHALSALRAGTALSALPTGSPGMRSSNVAAELTPALVARPVGSAGSASVSSPSIQHGTPADGFRSQPPVIAVPVAAPFPDPPAADSK